jgi:hypothetical protein
MPPIQSTSAASVMYRTTTIPSFYYCLGPHPARLLGAFLPGPLAPPPYNCHVGPDWLRAGDLESMTSLIVDDIRRDPVVPPLALTFLLRRYAVTEHDQLGEALGAALAVALDAHRDATTTRCRAEWLTVFAEACAVSNDSRLQAAVRELVYRLRQDWPGLMFVDEAAFSLEACLRATSVAETLEFALVPAVVEELERIVGAAYRPGFGISHTINRSATPRGEGGPSDQIRTASALLTAFEETGRLPYAMLADELIQSARNLEQPVDTKDRDEPDRNDAASDDRLFLDCEAVQVLCRLAALYDDPEYRRTSVTLTDVSYRCDASCLLKSQAARLGRDGEACESPPETRAVAAYGLALMALTT